VWFKTATLAELGATPTVERRVVASDLRQDWPAALWHAGFDAARPHCVDRRRSTRLPATRRPELIDAITALSAKGSWLGLDTVPPLPPSERDSFRQRIVMLIGRWKNHGFNVDMTDMVYLDEHNDMAACLATDGWEMVGASTSELFLANGLDAIAEHDDDRAPFAIATYISAKLRVRASGVCSKR